MNAKFGAPAFGDQNEVFQAHRCERRRVVRCGWDMGGSMVCWRERGSERYISEDASILLCCKHDLRS